MKRRQNGEPIRQWRLLFIFALALLTHEMGILLLPLGLFLAWISTLPGRALPQKDKGERIKDKKRDSATSNRHDPPLTIQKFISSTINYFLPFILLATLYLILYTFLPRGAGPLLDYGGNPFGPKLLLLLQTLTYPLVPLFDLALSGPAAIWLATAILLGALILSLILYPLSFSAVLRHPSSFGLLFFLLFAALVAFTLPTYYIEDGARLLYPMGIGVALVWGSLFSVTSHQLPINSDQLPVTSRFWHDNRLTRTKGLASLAQWLLVTLLLFTVIHSAWFTRRMVGLYDMLAGSVRGITFAETVTNEETAVFVNFPQWVTWPEEVWPQGNEFAPLLGDHLFLSELLRVNFGVEPDIVNLHVPERLANTPYAYGLYGVSAVSALDLTRLEGQTSVVFTQTYTEQGPQTTYTGQFGPAEEQSNPIATLGELQLIDAAACIKDSVVEVEMTLQQVDKVGLNQTFFVQALDASGQLVGQADGPAAGLPPGRIQFNPGSRVIDQRIVPITATPVEILFGLYDFTNGERAIAMDSSGGQLADNSVRVDPTVCQ